MSTKETAKKPAEKKTVSIEEVLGCLINAVNNQTRLIETLLERIPPKASLDLSKKVN